MRFSNLVDTLFDRAKTLAERPAFEWSSDDALEFSVASYGRLHARAKEIAGQLQRSHSPGERAILLFPPGLEFIDAFFGCIYAGLIAVPACPPRRFRPSDGILGILDNAKPAIVLSTASFASNREEWFASVPQLLDRPWLAVDAELNGGCSESWCRPPIEESTIAFLQYTSGTTGSPKGVMVSHGNLAYNAETIHRALGPDEHPRRAFWLPMYHDMGLIGAMLQTVFDGATSAWISPSAFLQRPLRWLELISQTGASMSGAPDFAYNYCVERTTAEQRVGVDLSNWKIAVSGAETIRPETIRRFAEAFADSGFRREAFQPGYGLAEATLVVSHEKNGVVPTTIHLHAGAIARNEVEVCAEECDEAREIASSGYVGRGQTVAIVDVATCRRCGEGQVGEIWVAGPHVAHGYYNNAQSTVKTFQATLPGEPTKFLRTGDLGFLLEQQLYVTGRKKELIVIRGRNLHPQDIEWAVRQSDQRIRNVASAVFSSELFGAERLIVIQEVDRNHRKTDFSELGQSVRRTIARECGVEVFDLLFVKEGQIPRTTSGKIRRVQCKADYSAERFDVIARWSERVSGKSTTSTNVPLSNSSSESEYRSTTEIREWLTERIARQLDIRPERLDENMAFSEIGLGSLDVVLICAEFEEWLGERLPPTMIYNYPTIEALTNRLGRAENPSFLPFRSETVKDTLQAEIDQLSHHALEAFIAEEMAKATESANRRAA